MEKSKFLSKFNIDIKDYNNELEKILENKLYSYDVKNLLLSMLYKIENAYKDYEVAKVEVPSKREYIENVLEIIKEKALKILLVKPETEEAKELEEKNIKYKVDKENGEIICFQNELVILTALYKLDETNMDFDKIYNYIVEPFNLMLNIGKIATNTEVIRDFNGWSWDIVLKEINDIQYNFMYQNLILLAGRDNINNKEFNNFNNILYRLTIQKYLSNKENEEYIKKFRKIKESKNERLELFENKKEFISKITDEKKEYTKQIEKIDKILNNGDLLKKEYYDRNEKLPNKEKIFSVSYLANILSKERIDLLDKINECNKIILPKEFVEKKKKLELEVEFLNSISETISEEDIIQLCNEFFNSIKLIINNINEENKEELVKWIYKLRYYRYIPINEKESIKDINELNEIFNKIIELIIKKAQTLKIIDNFTEDNDLTFKIVKEIFNTKIIKLENINIQCRYEEKILYVEYYDDTIIENTTKFNIDNVRIKKKIKLFI